MEPAALIGILGIIGIVIALLVKTYLEKRRIEQARLIVDLQDSLRRMQNAHKIIPEVYLDKATKLFIHKRMLQITQAILATDNSESQNLSTFQDELTVQVEQIRNQSDDVIKRLGAWAPVPNQDAAHELKRLTQFLHAEVVRTTKSGDLKKGHALRVIKNLKIIANRIPLDMNFALGRAAAKLNKPRPALSKFKVAQGIIKRSPIKQHLSKQEEQLTKLIKKCELKLERIADEAKAKSGNSLAEGMNEMEEKEKWEQKKNYFDD